MSAVTSLIIRDFCISFVINVTVRSFSSKLFIIICHLGFWWRTTDFQGRLRRCALEQIETGILLFCRLRLVNDAIN